MADTTNQQIANLTSQIVNLQAGFAGTSQVGVNQSAFGNLNVYGGLITNGLYPTTAITSSSIANPTVVTTSAAHNLTTGDSVEILNHAGSTPSLNGYNGPVTVLTATTFSLPINVTAGGTGGTVRKITMQLSVNGQAASDSANWNPGFTSPPVRISQYANQALVSGFSWFRDQVNVGTSTDASWPLTTAPGTGYHRYDIVYAYISINGPSIGVATGTAVLNAGTPVAPTLPQETLALAQIHVQSNVVGIISTVISDLRNFSGRMKGTPGIPGSAGPIGFQGEQGEEGVSLIPGPVGPQGNTGATGSTGLTGNQGPTGPAVFLVAEAPDEPFSIPGPTGPQGATGGGGTVTSVGLSLPADFTVSGSPVTGAGTLAAVRASQTANLFLASPNGAPGAPSYRAIVAADVPPLNQNTTGTAAGLSATLAISSGGTGTTTSTGTGSTVLSASPALTGTPTAPTGAIGDTSTQIATNAFVANAINAAVDTKDPVVAATTAALLFTPTYNNGASGVGATLTGTVGVLVVDGYTPALNDRILVQNQASTFQNGCYVLTTVGTALVGFVLTRSLDFNQTANIIYGDSFPVLNGTANKTQQFTMNNNSVITVGTTGITFAQTSGGSQLTATTPIVITGNAVSAPTALTATAPTAHGVLLGAGTQAVVATGAGTAGQVLTSNGASVDPSFQSAGGGVALDHGFLLSNDAVTPNTKLDIASGSRPDSTFTAQITGTAFTKTTAAFVAGTGNGGMTVALAQGWYHVFAAIISGSYDVFFDSSFAAAHKPAGTTSFVYIGSFKTNGSPFNIIPWIQVNQFFKQYTAIYTGVGTTTTTTVQADSPPDISTLLFIEADIGPATAGNYLTVTDIANNVYGAGTGVGGAYYMRYYFWVPTDTNKNIRYISSSSSDSIILNLLGYTNPYVSPRANQ